MADTKITALTAISTVDPAVDVFPIVDVSDTTMAASGTTKKITSNQLLGAGGTATLASATITGDLTVDTSTLKVDSANNRVGIGVAVTGFGSTLTVSGDIEIVGGNKTLFNSAGFLQIGTSTANYLALQTNSTERYRIASDGVATWSNVGGVAGTAMTLNSTGLGVGGSPTRKLSIVGSGNTYANINSGDNTSLVGVLFGGTSAPSNGQIIYNNTDNSMGLHTAGAVKLTIDSSGNVGVGGSPSAKLHVVGGNIRINDSYQLEFGGTTNAIAGSNANNTMNIYTNNVLRVSAKANGQIRFIPLSSDPSGAEAGDVYYNSTSNKLKCYNGTTWNDLF